MGERVVPNVLAGKKVGLLGALDVPHSLSYMPDVVRTLVTIAGDERAWGASRGTCRTHRRSASATR